MLHKTKMALAAALILGSASAVLAGEGSPDINVPKGYSSVALQQYAPLRNDVLDAYASTQWQGRQARHGARPFTAEERELFDRETGNVDRN